MLTLLCEREETGFDRIAMGDESWFLYHHEPRGMFAGARREKVSAYIRTQFGVSKNYDYGFLRDQDAERTGTFAKSGEIQP
jgi:hypothetical protein